MSELGQPPGRLIWRNGQLIPWKDAVVHVNAVGHASVSGAFEGVHSYWSPSRQQLLGFRVRDHMRRMLDSLRLSGLVPGFDADELTEATIKLLASVSVPGEDVYIRPWGFAQGLHREQMVAQGTPAEIVIDSWTFESKLGRGRTCTLAVSSWLKFDHAATPAAMKVFSNYHNGRLGTMEARARGADWPIFLTPSGEVTESSGAAIALVSDGVLRLPDLSAGVLDSITRRTLLVLAAELDIPVQAGRLQRTDLYLADEVFLLGTAAEVLPAVEVDGFAIGDGASAGKVTRRLEAAYHEVVRGAVDGHDEWLTPVP